MSKCIMWLIPEAPFLIKIVNVVSMKYNIVQAIEILQRTPGTLDALLAYLSEEWIINNEGPETFSPYDVVGHMVHGEKRDWTERIKMILEHGNTKSFVPYDRFAMYTESKGKTMGQLLDEFSELRKKNIAWLLSLDLTEADLDRKGMHPKLGEVTLRNLLATWVIHDLTHIAQVTRVMAKQLKTDMGPWVDFFRIMSF